MIPFGRVFARLDAAQFERCLLSWVQHLHELAEGQLLAIDGKTVRRSHDQANQKRPSHLVSVWAAANRLVLAQTEVDADGNEITTIPELLQMLELSGCIVTIDAIGCQKSIAQLRTERGVDYLLALKKNQAQLYDEVRTMFTCERKSKFVHLPHNYHQTVEKDHGRIEIRRCWATADPQFLNYMNPEQEWTQLQSLVMVECERHCLTIAPVKRDTSSPVPPMLNNSWLPRGDTGASKTRSTGSWTSPFAKTKAASAKGMPNITWLSCDVWLSISCATRKPPKSASPLNANGLAGITTIFLRCYKIKMRLPCCRCRILLRSVDFPIHHILEQPIGVQ